MGRLTRNFDWSKTAVGAPPTWPHSLRTTVSNLLLSKFPMFLWWGADMIQFYNDAYRPSMGSDGKHPEALGQNGRACWPEIWNIISPLLDQVRRTGEAVWKEDQLVPIYRNGKLEDVYWTFSYSPVMNDEGEHGGILVTCAETTGKVNALRRLAESEKLLRNTIHQAPVAICVYRGHEFVIEEANDRMFEFWGKDAAEVLNKPLSDAIPEAKNQGYEELLANVYQTGQPFSSNELPVTLLRNDILQTFYINFSYTPLFGTDRTISGIMAMAVDVTDQVLARSELRKIVEQRTVQLTEAQAALSGADRNLKRSHLSFEEFAYAASHDLKEPIRRIHFFGERIKNAIRGRLTSEEQRDLERLESATVHMEVLVDDLLAYSQASVQPDTSEEVDLHRLFEVVLRDLAPQIKGSKAVVNVGQLCTIKGHSRQLQTAFHNLLSNALTYNNTGVPPHVYVGSRTVLGTDTGRHLPQADRQRTFQCIEVRDNGIGFQQEDAERIFNLFTRLHGGVDYKGTGIGLSTVRKIVENHNGYIWAESKPGAGATFKVLLRAD